MKAHFLLIITFILYLGLLVFTACGKNNDKSSISDAQGMKSGESVQEGNMNIKLIFCDS